MIAIEEENAKLDEIKLDSLEGKCEGQLNNQKIELIAVYQSEQNKCNKYRCITLTTTGPCLGVLFSLLANCLLLFCSDLAVLMFTMLLARIKDLIKIRHMVHGDI